MPRGDNPNSRKNLKKAYGGKGGFDTETARKAKEKSDESKSLFKSLTADLKERCTPEHLEKMNTRIIQMAEHGNLKAWELIRDTLGEKPVSGAGAAEKEDQLRQAKEILGGVASVIE